MRLYARCCTPIEHHPLRLPHTANPVSGGALIRGTVVLVVEGALSGAPRGPRWPPAPLRALPPRGLCRLRPRRFRQHSCGAGAGGKEA